MFGFIGAGNMVSAIATGAFNAGFLTPENCIFTDKTARRAPQLATALQATYLTENYQVAQQSEVLILGVKPNVILDVLADISDTLQERQPLVISLAAGTSIADLETVAGPGVPVIRFMPNVNASIGKSVTAICLGTHASDAHRALAIEFAETFGTCLEIDESHMSTFTALAGSSPAWIFELIDSFAMAGVKNGLSKTEAVQIVAQTFIGSACLVLNKLESQALTPNNLIDQVCSPGGTTIAGLLALRSASAGTAITAAVDACINRDKELGAQE